MQILNITKSIDACAAHYGDDAEAMRDYLIEGQKRALEMDNRGPITFDADGKLDPAIREAYSKYGFYIFTDAISADELADLQNDIADMRERFAVDNEAAVDKHGRPALGRDHKAPSLTWVKPLSIMAAIKLKYLSRPPKTTRQTLRLSSCRGIYNSLMPAFASMAIRSY